MTQSNRLGWSLSRVIYLMAGVVAAWFALEIYDDFTVSIYRKDPARFSTIYHAVIATPFVYVLTLALAICFFRPAMNLFRWDKEPTRYRWRRLAKPTLLGLAGGLLVSLLSAPFPITHNYKLGDIAGHLSGSNSAYLFFPISMLLVSAIAICTEVFFRGIVMRTLAEYSNVSASIIASCLLSAYMWSFDSPAVTAVILGAVSGILFYKTRHLLPSIMAAIVFLFTGPLCSAIFHRFVW